MENYIEYSLPYKLTPADQMKRMLSVFVPMMVGVLSIMFIGLIGIVICGVLCWVSYRLYLSFFYELEYTFLEDEIRFGKIINKERRKDLLTASIPATESYGPIENKPQVNCKTVSFLSNQGDLPCYYWITSAKKERVCILFQPDERLLKVFEVRARGKKR